ncbi:MAG: hypothetical protein FWC36_00555 [Spirochaetes bacterium]|nr:hypothetical protein [Spirochaetota bacterium]
MEVKAVLVVVLLLFLFGCDTSTYDILGRKTEAPFVDAPVVRSFAAENRILISWSEDSGADTYILERAEDNAFGLVFSEIYRGRGLSYIDRDVVDQTRYLYRLSKQRGSRIGWVSPSVLGIGSVVRMDEHEPNDTEETATWIGPMRISNIYYFRSHCGQTVSDVDWYYVVVPAYTVATIVVEDYQVINVDGTTHMKIVVKGGGPAAQIIHNAGINLTNPNKEERRIYFKIIPNEDMFITSAAQAGGAVVQYAVYIITMSRL